MTLDIKYINKLLSAEKVTRNMVLSAKVESKEAKGYLLNFEFRDRSKGFLKFGDNTENLKIGQTVTVVVKSVVASSKVIKCELLSKANNKECVQQANEESNLVDNDFRLTAAHLKPGFLVSAKVSKLFETYNV